MGNYFNSCVNLDAALLTADVVDGMVDALVYQAVDNQWLARNEALALEESVAYRVYTQRRLNLDLLVIASDIQRHHSSWMPPQREASSMPQGVAVDVMRVKDLRRCCVAQVATKVVPVAVSYIAREHVESKAAARVIAVTVTPQALKGVGRNIFTIGIGDSLRQ